MKCSTCLLSTARIPERRVLVKTIGPYQHAEKVEEASKNQAERDVSHDSPAYGHRIGLYWHLASYEIVGGVFCNRKVTAVKIYPSAASRASGEALSPKVWLT